MEFQEYQHQLVQMERERGWDRVLPGHTFMHMGEEMGEIARVLERFEGYRTTDQTVDQLREALAGELADLTAFVFKLASQFDIDMSDTMQAHLEKFRARFYDVEQGQAEMARYLAHQEKNLDWIKGNKGAAGNMLHAPLD
ncbi:MAG: hypothetical protein JW934_12635 [Anaerolineae bacterium]|nr:hypothetical protein [Anaerolineae bacterium]